MVVAAFLKVSWYTQLLLLMNHARCVIKVFLQGKNETRHKSRQNQMSISDNSYPFSLRYTVSGIIRDPTLVQEQAFIA